MQIYCVLYHSMVIISLVKLLVTLSKAKSDPIFSPRTLTLKLFDMYSIEQLKISNVIFYDICHAVPYPLHIKTTNATCHLNIGQHTGGLRRKTLAIDRSVDHLVLLNSTSLSLSSSSTAQYCASPEQRRQ